MRKLRMAIWAAVAVFAAILGYAYYTSVVMQQPPLLAVKIGGDFQLASSKGGILDSKTLRGKPYAVFFGFTNCPEVCPTTLYDMSSALTRLGDQAGDFRVLFISVDPERDTIERMRDYIANFDPRMEALVPTEEQLRQVAKDFRVYFRKVPTSDGSYTMDHTATVYLMDRDGQLASTIAYEEDPQNRDLKLRKLLGL